MMSMQMGKGDANPIDRANAAPRCTATAKRTGKPCLAPAVTGWRVCRVHGAGGGQKPGPAHPNFRHGERSHGAVALRAQVDRLVKQCRASLLKLH
ncbi:hypothetical protein [Paracoccus liaowanqingii]|uniref:hypothetical protein n=1 Tax=Paracoccus liaowanqingii TaxID=2560053 RepID=UPI00159BCFED|nr:hypothetical protein [Paracoccus liaowanqingii]